MFSCDYSTLARLTRIERAEGSCDYLPIPDAHDYALVDAIK